MNTEKMIIKATFELPGKVQVRLVVLGGYQQKAQIRLGENWLPFTDVDAQPYVQIFNQLSEFEKFGATTFQHIKAYGLAGRIGTMPTGETAYYWRDLHWEGTSTHWLEATEEQIAEINSYRNHVEALKPEDPVVVLKMTDINTGQGKWVQGNYQYATPEGHFVTVKRERLRTPFVLALEDGIREAVVAAPQVVA